MHLGYLQKLHIKQDLSVCVEALLPQTNLPATSPLCNVSVAAARHLNATVPLTAWPHCSCSGALCWSPPPTSARESGCEPESLYLSDRARSRGVRRAATVASDRDPGVESTSTGRAASELRCVSGITAFDVKAGSPAGHGRVFTSEP